MACGSEKGIPDKCGLSEYRKRPEPHKNLQCVVKQYGRIDMFVCQLYQVAVVRKKYYLSLL